MFPDSLIFYPGGQWSFGGIGNSVFGSVRIKPVGEGTTLE